MTNLKAAIEAFAVVSNAEIASLMNENRETLASLDELRDENTNLLQAAKRFQASFSQSLSLLGLDKKSSVSQASVSNSDLTSLFSSKESDGHRGRTSPHFCRCSKDIL